MRQVIIVTWLAIVCVQILVNDGPTWVATAAGAIVGQIGGYALARSRS
jgi:hypothetical protein